MVPLCGFFFLRRHNDKRKISHVFIIHFISWFLFLNRQFPLVFSASGSMSVLLNWLAMFGWLSYLSTSVPSFTIWRRFQCLFYEKLFCGSKISIGKVGCVLVFCFLELVVDHVNYRLFLHLFYNAFKASNWIWNNIIILISTCSLIVPSVWQIAMSSKPYKQEKSFIMYIPVI